MSPVQQVRFLTVVLPAAYWTEAQKRVTFLTATYFLFHPIDEDLKRLLKQAFRVVFDAAPTPARERVLAHYLGLVRTGASRYLEAFEDAFVQDEDLQYLGERDRALATKRLVTRGRLHTPTPTC